MSIQGRKTSLQCLYKTNDSLEIKRIQFNNLMTVINDLSKQAHEIFEMSIDVDDCSTSGEIIERSKSTQDKIEYVIKELTEGLEDLQDKF